MYNYMEAMKEDIRNYIENNINMADYESREELEDCLNDDLWTEDSVTGNGSGSYTFDREEAKSYVIGNKDLAEEMVNEFCIKGEEIANHLFDYEWWDVSIRCYLLGDAIAEVLDEMGVK